MKEDQIKKANSSFMELIGVWRLIQGEKKLPPHFFVYGALEKNDSNNYLTSLSLKGVSYWGEWCIDNATCKNVPKCVTVDLGNLSSFGWKLPQFKAYVQKLLDAKCVTADDNSGWMYGTIMSVSNSGTAKLFSVIDFVKSHLSVEFKESKNISHTKNKAAKP